MLVDASYYGLETRNCVVHEKLFVNNVDKSASSLLFVMRLTVDDNVLLLN